MKNRLSHLLPKPEQKPRRCKCGELTRGPDCATCHYCYPGKDGSGYGGRSEGGLPWEQRGDIEGNKRKHKERELAAKAQGRTV